MPLDVVNPVVPRIVFWMMELNEFPAVPVEVFRKTTPVVVDVAWLSRFKFRITLLVASSTRRITGPMVAADLVLRIVHSFELPVPPGLPSKMYRSPPLIFITDNVTPDPGSPSVTLPATPAAGLMVIVAVGFVPGN